MDLMDRLLPLDPFLNPSQFQYIPPQSSHPSTYPPSCEGKKPRVRRCTIDQRVLIFGVGGQLRGEAPAVTNRFSSAVRFLRATSLAD